MEKPSRPMTLPSQSATKILVPGSRRTVSAGFPAWNSLAGFSRNMDERRRSAHQRGQLWLIIQTVLEQYASGASSTQKAQTVLGSDPGSD